MQQYLSGIHQLASALASHGHAYTEKEIYARIANGLPAEYAMQWIVLLAHEKQHVNFARAYLEQEKIIRRQQDPNANVNVSGTAFMITNPSGAVIASSAPQRRPDR